MRVWINTKGPGGAFVAYAPSLAVGAFVLEREEGTPITFCRVDPEGAPLGPAQEQPDGPTVHLFLYSLAQAHLAEIAACEGRGWEA
jgi:hypothetical protein